MPEAPSGNFLESRTEALLLSKSDLEEYDNDCLDIYLFTQREISLIYSCLRYSNWSSRWEDGDVDRELVETVHRKLLMLCVEDLVKTNLALIAAMTGRTIDLGSDEDIQTFLTSVQDFSTDGVVPAIDRISGSSQIEDELQNIVTLIGGSVLAL